ncbi:MAG: hypothetical protein J6B86_06815 [Clostridia bacterium]|nr:hypothetical protein [Clostridia bacterium]
MKFFRKKLLSFLLVVALVLSVMPSVLFANAQTATVLTEEDLKAAIEAIPAGGSGEITIANVYMYLNEGLYIENKDITFNLVSAALVTAKDPESGYGQPVIFGYGANITVNLDDNSLMQSMGHTGNMGVVRIDNSTDWNEAEQSFEKTFTLTVNGGQYADTEEIPEGCEADYVFVAAPGTKVVLTDVVCNGTVTEIDYEGVGITVPGEMVINGGKFTNDVSEYAADGKVTCTYGENYYVRDKEMTDDFSKPLTDGKVVFPYAKPSADDEAVWLIAEDFSIANPEFYFAPEGFKEDFTKLELGLYYGTAKEEFHVVDVVWDYDADVLQTAQSFIEKFPEDRPWFNVTDLELVNYWVNRNADSEVDSLANYSGELKSILGNSNFLYNVEIRGGADDVFYTERIGSAKLIHDGKVYFASTMIGARAEHAIYVPESTADTKDALIAAAQKRIDDYIGENVIKITAATETVTDYYNNTLAEYDEAIANAQIVFDREAAKSDAERDWSAYWDAKNTLDYTPGYKQYFMDSFQEGGDLQFLKNAAGDFFFNVEVVGKEESYKFVIIKDDTKLSVPSYATVDLDTNVSVTTDSSTVPLDTVIEVSKLTEGTDYDRIIQILDVEENETFDIKLHSASLDEYVTKLEDGKFEVKIPLPEKFKGKENLIVYYVDENDTPIPYPVTIDEEENSVSFLTDHFSIYTLAEQASQQPEHTQHNGGSATCCTKAICSECNQPYGEFNAANHSGGTELKNAKEATEDEKGYTGDTYCKGCGEKIADGEEIPETEPVVPPQTDDNGNLWLWVALLLVSGGCLLGIARNDRKKKNCK